MKTGRIPFDIVTYSSHTYFPSLDLLFFFLQRLLDLSSRNSVYLIFLFQMCLLSCISLFTWEKLQEKIKGVRSKVLFALALYSLVIPSFPIFPLEPAYDFVGFALFFLVLTHVVLYDHHAGFDKVNVIILVLYLGVVIAAPRAIILIVIITFAYYLLAKGRNIIFAVLSIIGVTYFSFIAVSYILALGQYDKNAMAGLGVFLSDLISGHFSKTLIPGGFPSVQTSLDVRLLSLSYIFIVIIALLSSVIPRFRGSSSFKAVGYSVLLLLFIFAFSYVGGSLLPSSAISDIRLITLIGLLVRILPYQFANNAFADEKILTNKVFALFVVGLLIASSYGMIVVYPKSSHDPLNVIEDPRVTGTNQYPITVMYISQRSRNGTVLSGDYYATMQLAPAFSGLSESSGYVLTNTNMLLIMNQIGPENGSLYFPRYLYSQTLVHALGTYDLVFRAGNVDVFSS